MVTHIMMHHSAYWLDFLWNDHSWYVIHDANDFVRAVLWVVTNLLTALAYYAIPYEIWLWRNELSSIAARIVGFGFVMFILLCGTHHIVDVIIMPTAPWWAVWVINVPMAVASIGTMWFIQKNRNLLLEVLRVLNRLVTR